MRASIKTLVIAGLLLVGSSAEAAIMTYIGIDENPGGKLVRPAAFPLADAAKTTFLSTLASSTTNSLESFANPTSTPFNLNFGAVTGTLSSSTAGYGGRVREQLTGANTQGRYPITGDKYFETDNAAGGQFGQFMISFSDPVAAFGFYAIDIGDFGGQLNVIYHLLGGGTHVETVGGTNTISGVIFLGVTTNDPLNPFTSIEFNNTKPTEDLAGYDNFIVGTLLTPNTQISETPEPGMLAIWGLGALAAGVITYRRKASA